jgi:hypothetical protein
MNPNLERLARETKNPMVRIDGRSSSPFEAGPNALVYSDGFNIRAHLGGLDAEVYRPWSKVGKKLCYHDDKIFYVGNGKLESPPDSVYTQQKAEDICSNGTDLFLVSDHKLFKYDLETEESEVLFDSDYDDVTALTASGDKLWHTWVTSQTKERFLREVDLSLGFTEKNSRGMVDALCYCNKDLFYSGRDKVYRLEDISDATRNIIFVREFDSNVVDLIDLNGWLVALTESDGVIDVVTNQQIIPPEKKAEAIGAVPKTYLQEKGVL